MQHFMKSGQGGSVWDMIGGGELIFTNNTRNFKMDFDAIAALD
jgi:hypothetical protein